MRDVRRPAIPAAPSRLAAAALASLGASILLAGPSLTGVSPPGGQRGTAVRLELRGTGLDGKIEISTAVPGSFTELSAEGPAREFLLEIAPDAEPGAYPLAVITEHGRTNTWLFSVSAFPELAEAEGRGTSNDAPGGEQRIQPPAVVNGTLGEADRDRYSVALEAGQRMVFEVEARRLGSAVDPVLVVRRPNGTVAARSDDAPGIGSDSRVDLRAAAGGVYTAEVHDVRFSAQQRNFYRLIAAPLEYAEAIFPLGWTAGEAVAVELSGGSLAAPATVTADGDRVAVPGERHGLPMPFLRGQGPEALEPSGPGPHRLAAGTVVNGRLAKPGEIDRYRLPVHPGEEWLIETQAAILRTSRLYTLLVMRDQDGSELASAGDQPAQQLLSNINTRAETFGDPALGIRVPDGVSELELAVQDLLGRGGPAFGYRLVARRQPADFIARLDDTELNIPRGGSASVGVTLDRRGYGGPVRVVAEGLPAGVAAAGGNIPAEFGGMTTQRNSLRGRLTFTASDSAQPGAATIKLLAEGGSGTGAGIRRRVLTSLLQTRVAGSKQRPVRLPGPPGEIEALVVDPAPAAIELRSARSVRLIQGLKHDVRWAYRTRQDGVTPLTAVSLINAPAVANLRVLGGAKIRPGDAEGTLEVNTTMGTPAMLFDLVLFGRVRHAGIDHAIYSAAITFEVVQGYRIGPPSQPATVRPGERFEISGSFSREPDFNSEVVLEAANLPPELRCDAASIGDSPAAYTLRCRAGEGAEPGEYRVEVAPRSVLAGRDEEAVPYNIPPVGAVVVVTAREGVAVARQL